MAEQCGCGSCGGAAKPVKKEEKPVKKLKKKFAHHHLIDSMKNYEHMRAHMKA